MLHWNAVKFSVVTLGILLVGSEPARAQHQDISIYSSSSFGGALVGTPAPGVNPVFRNDALCFPTACLFSSTDPGIITPSSQDGGFFPVAPGTDVSIEVVAIDSAVSVKVGAATLDAVGSAATVGTAPGLHVHPIYQLIVPEDEAGQYAFHFRFTAPGYEPSQTFTMLLSNEGEVPTPTPTPTPAPTATPSPSPTPSPEATPAPTPSPGPTAEPTPSPTPTSAPTPPVTPSPSPRPEPTPVLPPNTPTPIAPGTPTPTAAPVTTPSATPTPTSTPVPSRTPVSTPLASPTPGASATPSPTATAAPTVTPTPATVAPIASLARSEPRARGDQLVFYYDAREGFTSFLNVANPGPLPVDVALEFYDFQLVLRQSSTHAIPAGGTKTIDVGSLVTSGLPRSAGLATAVAVDGAGMPVTSAGLAGNFTVANLGTNSAWGGPAPARRAFRKTAGRYRPAAVGTVIDGDSVVLEPLLPEQLDVATYYNPSTLEPAESGGHQLIFVSFADVVGGAGIAAETSRWRVEASRNDGTAIPSSTWTARGVDVSDLLRVAGDGIDGGAGRIGLVARPSAATVRMAFFQESLGTFATGYRLPPVLASPETGPEGETGMPHARGDQLVFFFDAGAAATSFLNVANEGDEPLDILLRFYSSDFSASVELMATIPNGGTRTFDVGALRSEGLPEGRGVAFAVAVDEAGRPIASHALAGNLTVANLATNSAWGAPAVARVAVQSSAGDEYVPAGRGDRVDGTTVFFEPLRPKNADLAVYYDPATLEAPELGGNRIIFVSFDDSTDPLAMRAGQATWRLAGSRSDGTTTTADAYATSGVEATHLAALAGARVDGAAGTLHFEVEGSSDSNLMVYFVESLGTFATGYPLPTGE